MRGLCRMTGVSHIPAAWNVSHWFTSPLSSPRRNQVIRCSELPCVKLSGTTRPWVSR